MTRLSPGTRHAQGFTLLEALLVVVIAGALVAVALPRLTTPAELTLSTQAQVAADLIRRAQSLAMLRGQRMRISADPATATLSIACTTGITPCSTDSSFTASQGVSVSSASAIFFNTLGQPLNNAGTLLASDVSYALSYASGGTASTVTITVAALTGRVSVSP